MTTTAQRAARLLLEAEAVRFRPHVPFVLGAGRESPAYVDGRRLIGMPRARRRLMDLATGLLADRVGMEAFDAVAGAETAGIPYAAWLADRLMLPMLYVRKAPKGFGRNARIEGRLHEGSRVLLVDDVATDATSKLAFADALREAGAVVEHALVAFAFDLYPESRRALDDAGVTLHALATWRDLLIEARSQERLPRDMVDAIQLYVDDPSGWPTARVDSR